MEVIWVWTNIPVTGLTYGGLFLSCFLAGIISSIITDLLRKLRQ